MANIFSQHCVWMICIMFSSMFVISVILHTQKKIWLTWLGLFSHESKVRNLNYHLNCAIWMIIHSDDGILDRVYAKIHRDALFEMRNSNDGPEVFSSYASLKSFLRSEIAVWMPWPLKTILWFAHVLSGGGGASGGGAELHVQYRS